MRRSSVTLVSVAQYMVVGVHGLHFHLVKEPVEWDFNIASGSATARLQCLADSSAKGQAKKPFNVKWTYRVHSMVDGHYGPFGVFASVIVQWDFEKGHGPVKIHHRSSEELTVQGHIVKQSHVILVSHASLMVAGELGWNGRNALENVALVYLPE